LFHLAQVKLCLSLAYDPQSDGQTEWVNRCLETYHHCFILSCPRKWLQWLSLVEYWYNMSKHSAVGRLSFEVLYGNSPKHFGISDKDVSFVLAVSSLMAE
jgi:hypothetical protein